MLSPGRREGIVTPAELLQGSWCRVVDERRETALELKPNQGRDSGFVFVYET
jgi:hypothetical protein